MLKRVIFLKAKKNKLQNSAFCCIECGNEVTKEFFQLQSDTNETKYVCQTCLQIIFLCRSCGEPVSGAYFTGNGLLLHPYCLKKLKVNLKTRNFLLMKITKSKCTECSQSINSQKFIYSQNGRLFHPECIPTVSL